MVRELYIIRSTSLKSNLARALRHSELILRSERFGGKQWEVRALLLACGKWFKPPCNRHTKSVFGPASVDLNLLASAGCPVWRARPRQCLLSCVGHPQASVSKFFTKGQSDFLREMRNRLRALEADGVGTLDGPGRELPRCACISSSADGNLMCLCSRPNRCFALQDKRSRIADLLDDSFDKLKCRDGEESHGKIDELVSALDKLLCGALAGKPETTSTDAMDVDDPPVRASHQAGACRR